MAPRGWLAWGWQDSTGKSTVFWRTFIFPYEKCFLVVEVEAGSVGGLATRVKDKQVDE